MTFTSLRPLAALLALAAIGSAPAREKSTRQGVYSDGQAEAGAQLYAVRCAMCHGRNLEGSYEIPALRGKFVANWSGSPVADLFIYLARAMPQFAPGSLSPTDNARIVAFLLKANGMPAGASPLPSGEAELRKIAFAPSGPAK